MLTGGHGRRGNADTADIIVVASARFPGEAAGREMKLKWQLNHEKYSHFLQSDVCSIVCFLRLVVGLGV